MLDNTGKSAVDLGEDSLRASLLLQDYKELGIEIHEDARKFGCQIWNFASPAPMPVLFIPYFHPLTGEPARYRPKHPAFFRLRCLKPPPPRKDGLKPQKYWQPENSGVMPYFPRHHKIDWKEVFDNVDISVALTEGEKKAACACTRGIPCIGFGGVHMWSDRKRGETLLPQLLQDYYK